GSKHPWRCLLANRDPPGLPRQRRQRYPPGSEPAQGGAEREYLGENVDALYRSNMAIADWAGQRWIKVAIQSKAVGNQASAGTWQYQEVTWMPEDKYRDYLTAMAQSYAVQGYAMRIGPSMSSGPWTEVVNDQLNIETSFIQGGFQLKAGNQ